MKNLLYTLTMLSIFVLPAHAQAECSCFPQVTAAEAADNSTFVLVAEVVDKTRVRIPEVSEDYAEYFLKISVDRVYKGNGKRRMTVRTPEKKDDCSVDLKNNTKYLIYAVGGDIPLVTKCSRTKPIDNPNAQEDMRRFGDKYTIPEED